MAEAFVTSQARKHFESDFSEIAWTAAIAILLFSPVIVIGNGLVFASILLDPFKNIRKSPSSGLIFSLALADLLAGILVGPLMATSIIFTVTNKYQPFSITIVSATGTVSVGVSLYSLVALSLDRRIAITTPLHYAYKVTKRKVRIVNVCIWCYFIIFGILAAVFENFNFVYFNIIASIHFLIAVFLLIFLSAAVVRSVHNQALIIKRTVDSENLIVLQNAFNREKVVTQTTVIMAVAFQICFWPYLILSGVAIAIQDTTDPYDTKIIVWLYLVSRTMVLANSLMNPFMYAWRLPKYKKAFQHFWNQLVSRLFAADVPHYINKSQLTTTEEKPRTPASLSLRFLEQNESVIGFSTTQQTICKLTFDNSCRQKPVYSTNYQNVENTWL